MTYDSLVNMRKHLDKWSLLHVDFYNIGKYIKQLISFVALRCWSEHPKLAYDCCHVQIRVTLVMFKSNVN